MWKKTQIYCVQIYWHRGVVVITTAQLRSRKPELRFCAAAYQRFTMVRISDNGPGWKQG